MSRNVEKGKREIMPPVITFIILLLILCTMGITRMSLKPNVVKGNIKGEYTEVPVSYHDIYEKDIMSYFPELENYTDTTMKSYSTYYIYTNYLNNHLHNETVKLSPWQYGQVKDKVTELVDVMKLEAETDFRKMSLDGKAVAINIAKEIYDICGLTIEFNRRGDIERIYDQTGNVIVYRNDLLIDYQFNMLFLIITLSIVTLLLGLAYYVTRKNSNHYREGVMYDGFDAKRYA